MEPDVNDDLTPCLSVLIGAIKESRKYSSG
jgi:hypothetical protein